MPEQSPGQRRIQVWRKSICMFKRNGKEQGPFHQAGYTDYALEARTEEKRRPDLIGLSDAHFALCEITFSPNKDDAGKYMNGRTCVAGVQPLRASASVGGTP